MEFFKSGRGGIIQLLPLLCLKKPAIFVRITTAMDSQNHKREVYYSGDDGHPWENQAEPERLIVETRPKEALSKNISLVELIFGQSLNWYFSVIAWPLFLLLFLEIGLRVLLPKYYPEASANFLDGLLSIIRIVLFGYLTVSAHKQFKATSKQIMLAAVLMGFLAGLVLGLFLLFWNFGLASVLNLIGLPLLLAAYGWLISWLLTKILYKI